MSESLRQVRERSGLSREELAQIYGVTRQTMHYWRVRGAPKYDTHAGRRIELVSAALIKAIGQGLLPLPPTLAKPQRKARIAAMAKRCQGLTPTT